MTHAFLSQLENDGRIKCVFSTRRQFCGEKFSWIKSVFFMHQRHVTTSAYWIKHWTPVYFNGSFYTVPAFLNSLSHRRN